MSYTEVELPAKHENLSLIYLHKLWNKMMKVQNTIRGQTEKKPAQNCLENWKGNGNFVS
jgi:hypothetical protein